MSSLYETDFNAWCESQAEALGLVNVSGLDTANLIEEIKDLGISRKKALESYLEVLLKHLIKMEIQADYENKKSWKFSIKFSRKKICRILKESPSLKYYFNELCTNAWEDAREKASFETGVDLKKIRGDCYTKEEIQGEDHDFAL